MSWRRRLAVSPSEASLVGVGGGVLTALWGGAVAVAPPGSVPQQLVFALGYVSVAFAAFSCVGLFVVLAGGGSPSRLARGSVAAVVAGLALLSVGAVAGVVAPATASVFVTPGVVATLVGLVAAALAGWRGGVLPRWSAALVLVGALVVLLFRPGGPATALVVPLGVAWAVVAGYLYVHVRRRTA
jgi:hypothetical protein